MPQLLSNMRRDAKVTLSIACLFNAPRLAGLVCTAIATSSNIDLELSLLLARILGADATPALAMYDALRADNVKQHALDAAAKASLSDEQYRVFDAVITIADSVQRDRHRLAHWIWGTCEELPNTLLVADPKFLRWQEIERGKTMARPSLADFLKQDGSGDKFLRSMYEIDTSKVFVYSESDLGRVVTDLVEALNALFLFRFYMRPMVKNLLFGLAQDLGSDQWIDLDTSDGALRRLNELRLFREALAREDYSRSQRNIPEKPT